MESQGNQNSDWREPEATPEHRRIRAALLGLPRLSCPVGFEFRLMQRIQGKTSRRRQTAGGWAIGWAGAGLGVAVAMIVSFVAFDLQWNSGLEEGTVTAGAGQSPAIQVESQPDLAGSNSATITDPGSESIPVESESVELASTKEDSAEMIRRGEIPEGLDQRVSGGGR